LPKQQTIHQQQRLKLVKTLASIPSRASNKNGKSKYWFSTRIAFVS